MPRAGLDFASNDYLGLATSQRLVCAVTEALAAGTPIGSTGSRLQRGNTSEHEQLETVAAHFFGAERSLFFGSGYMANLAVLTTLPQQGDLLIFDTRAHPSMHAAAHAGFAEISEVPHNDLNAIEDAIRAWRSSGGIGRVWIAVESLYGMDGDRAPLRDLASLSDYHDAFLFIDDAHATGLYGPDGRGLTHDLEGRENVVVLHACGKALGCSGALVTAPNVLCEFLVNRCRPFIYATAPSPLIAVAVTEALAIIRDEPQRREKLQKLVVFANRQIQKRHGFVPSGSQIIPIHIGDNSRTLAIAAILRARGYDLRGVLPPTVPDGRARLRISLTLNVSQMQLSNMIDALIEELEGNCC